MNKLLLFSFVITCCLVGFSHSSVCTNNTASTTPPTGVTKLNLAVDSSYIVTYNYYFTTDNSVQVSVSACSDSAVNPFIGLSSSTDSVTLTVSPLWPTSTTPAATPGPSTVAPPLTVQSSPAGRVSFSPLAAVMSICLACVFVFPKQRFSLFVVFVVLALAFCAPVSQAEKAAATTITINIGIPPSFASACSGTNNCVSFPAFPYVISLNNMVYSTVDQAAGACVNGQPMTIPNGWTIAPYSDEAGLVIVFNNWTADAIITLGSTAYLNNQLGKTTAGSYDSKDNTVSVANCAQKVLITPSVKGSFPTDPKYTLISTVSVTNIVTFEGLDYAAADNTAFGTATRTSQGHAVYIQSTDAWQVATYSTNAGGASGKAQVAVMSQTNSFGADCIAMNFDGVYTSFNASSFAKCGTSDVSIVTYGNGYVYGVAPGSSYTTKILVSRASPKAGTLDSWNTMPVITETYELGGKLYALLDNAPVNGASASGCQGRFYAKPINSWYYASSTELSALITDLQTSGKWASTTCFNNGANSTSRAGVSGCAGSIVLSAGLSKFYVTSSLCSRTVIVHSKPAASFTIGLKVAVISSSDPASNNSVVALAISMLQARQIPYDVFYTTDSTTSLILTSGSNNPLYYALVLCESMILSAANTALRQQLEDYKFNYDVRAVALNAYPDVAQGVVIITNGKSAVSTNFYLDSNFTATFAEHIDGVVPTSLFEIATGTSVYYTVNPGYNAVTFLRSTASNSSVVTSNDDIIGALVTNTDGTEELQFFAPLNGNAYAGPVLGNVWVSWMTRGLYLGYRRVYFNPQIDDLLLPTQQFGSETDSQRMSGDDMAATAQWFENELVKILPAGSYVTLTFGINGWGQLNVSAYDPTADHFGIKPVTEVDTLADSIVTFYNSFFWESHTFSHKDFSCFPEPDPDQKDKSCQSYTPAATIAAELNLNNQYFNEELFKNLGGIYGPRFSPNCMITPAITGLQGNPVSIDAIRAANMTCVVGDNTRPVLIAPNPYDGLFSTNAVNGGTDGAIFIIPRFATEVYYNTYNPHYLEAEYNWRYGPGAQPPYKPAFDHDLSTDEIMVREANANFWHLSALRHDPFMFHQCNLIHWPYTAPGDAQSKQWSLVTLWVKAVVEKYITHMNLPLLSNKQQDLQDIYFARRARNACNITGTVSVNNGVMGSVTLSGATTCTPIVTGISSCSGNTGAACHVDSYGEDRTAYVTLPASKTATISAGGQLW